MNKKIVFLLLFLVLVVGCSDNVSKKTETNNNIEKKEPEKIDVDNLVFPLYRMTRDDYNYFYANDNIRITSSKIIIDNEKKRIIDLEKKELLDYNDYIKNNPSNTIINFILVRNECRKKVSCTKIGGCQIGNYGIQDLSEMIDPVNGVTLNYLMYEWCPIEISDDLIKKINNLEGFKVWGRGLEDINGEKTPLSIAIEFPAGETYPNEKKLFDEYGLLDLFNASPKKYFSLGLNSYTCNEYNLKCENKDK